jgi:hypothetical protein
VEQGGAFVAGSDGAFAAFTGIADTAGEDRLSGGELVLRAGKKRCCRVVAG